MTRSPDDGRKKPGSSDVPDAEESTGESAVPRFEDGQHRPTMPIRGVPPPLPIARKTSASVPPPIPNQRRTRTDVTLLAPKLPATGSVTATLATGEPESPTVLDRALVSLTDAAKARAERIAKELDAAAGAEPTRAAALAYELGELCERTLHNEERALASYRRALELDSAHRPNRWALRRVLYRRALWPELERLIDIEIKGATEDAERVDLLFERALVSGRRKGGDDQARTALVGASQLAPHHQGVLFELERVVARSRDKPRLFDIWERLAEALDDPERKIAYLLEVGRGCAATDHARATRAFEAASQQAVATSSTLAARVARERLRVADAHGTPPEIAVALDSYANAVNALVSDAASGERRTAAYARLRELAALRRRQAQIVRADNPAAAWTALQDALSLCPDDPLLLAELIEIAAELGRYKELMVLVGAWRTAESESGRMRMLSAWCAEARLSPDRRIQSRVLLSALQVAAPGFILLFSASECDALAEAGQYAELAGAYLDAASATASGTWIGSGATPLPDPSAAAALYVGAADLLAYYVGTPEATAQARDVLEKALAVSPGHAAAMEAVIELDDVSDQPKAALARCRELADASPADRNVLERGLRVAVTHNVTDAVLDFQRRIVALEPADCWAGWRLDATLAQHGREEERAGVLMALAKHETDPARRLTAMIGAARHQEKSGDTDSALALYRELLPLCAQDSFIRDAYSELLRARERWEELAADRRDVARTTTDSSALRRALREAAWVLEVRLDDHARAAEVYEEWLARLPDDRTALEGVARCRAALRDPVREVSARATIADIDQTTEASWLYARSLERAGRYVQAIEQYRALLARDESSVALAAAALALGELAGTGANISMRVEAAEALARRTSDTGLGASLYEQMGWMQLVALADVEGASQSFSSALSVQADRHGALLGSALTAARRGDRLAQGIALATLAPVLPAPDAQAAVLLRSAALATAAGESALASDRIEAALRTAPDDVNVLFVITEAAPMQRGDTTDPFAAVDRVLGRAELLARRAAIVDDPAARIDWELDRADALELAGQDREASIVLAAVLEQAPDSRRAVAAIRRIARRAGDHQTWAQASFVLSKMSRDRPVRLRLLREAASVYDRPGSTLHAEYARAIYQQIVALDPGGPESERLLELLRESGEPAPLVNALTDQLTRLASAGSGLDEYRMVPMLLERATLLRAVGNTDAARADLDVILSYTPHHVEALRQRADLAVDTGDTPSAIAMWQRYLAVETTGSRRVEVERLLAEAIDSIDDVAPPPPPAPPASERLPRAGSEITDVRAFEDDHGTWEMEFTAPDALAPPPGLDGSTPLPRSSGRRISQNIRRIGSATTEQRAVVEPTFDDPFSANTVVGEVSDPFGGQTATADLSSLQEEERRLAHAAAKLEADSVVAAAAAPAPQRRAAVFTAPRATTGLHDVVDPRRTTEQQAVVAPPRSRRLSAQSIVEQKSMVTVADKPASLQQFIDEKTNAAPQSLFPPVLTKIEGVAVVEPTLDPRAMSFPERDASLEESAAVLLSYDQIMPASKVEAVEDTLHELERELGIATDDPSALLGLRLEAARLAESGGELERARGHYEAALAVEPRSRQALRGLRRLARERGDAAEATRLLDRELACAGPRERAALLHHRLDLLLASGELAAARAAAEELLQGAPSSVSSLLAALELSLAEDGVEGLAAILERLAEVTTGALRAAVQGARAVLAARHADSAAAGTWFAAAAASDPESPALRLEAIRDEAARGQPTAGGALLDLAYRVEREDPITAAAIAVRSQSWSGSDSARENLAAAAHLAAGAAPRDPLVGRIAAETALVAEDAAQASHAFARWVRCKAVPVERAFAAARAAELDPGRLGRLWAQVVDLDAGDDYAAARLRSAHVAAEAKDQVLELDLQLAKTSHRDVPLLRAAAELVRQRRPDEAIELLESTREYRPSWALAEALADAYGAAKQWTARADILRELAVEPGLLASDVVRLRSAVAADRAARATARSSEERERLTAAALDAWNLVLGDDPRSIVAHAAAISHASRLEDRGVLVKVLARARGAERSPWGAASLSLRYARMLMPSNPRLAQTVIRDAAAGLDDPRPTLARMLAAAARRDLTDAIAALEDRATLRESKQASAAPTHEPAMLRVRAAHLALDAGDVVRAKALLARVDKVLPGLVDDLQEVARLRAGDPSPTAIRPRAVADGFARSVRDGDIAAARGDNALALQLYQRALAHRPEDPFAAGPLLRIGMKLRATAPIAAVVREGLRAAQERGDALAKADAYELLARIDELRLDMPAVFISLENAVQLDPTRIDLAHQISCELAATSQYAKLLAQRMADLDRLETGPLQASERDRVAMLFDTATLSVLDKRSDEVIAKLYHSILELDRRNRLALFHLDSIMRKAGPSESLAALEDHIASSFESAAFKATFITRAGETLAEIGKRAEAVQRFVRAAELAPEYVPALEAWHDTALAGELWTDAAEAATRLGALGGAPEHVGALYHLAGVALMDKARVKDGAVTALRRALDAVPMNLDALLRLRALLEHTTNREEYAGYVRRRLDAETDRAAQIELHRMLAEHSRNAGHRDEAVRQYRAMLALDPTDVRAHAAIADLSTEQSDWQTVVEAVNARIPLEKDVHVLRTLYQRLGMLYAEHDVQQGLQAFQRALAYRPDDNELLVRLTDLAINAGQWDVAVGACDRLVTSERDPEQLAGHLHRAARIFYRGFSDRERAERMVRLAIDSAPASADSLGSVVAFYREAGDPQTLHVQLDRVSELMRARIEADITDAAAYRTLARAAVARSESSPNSSPRIARAAAELAGLLGGAGDAEHRLVADEPAPDLGRLIGPLADDELFAGSTEPMLRELLRRLADPIAKHVGVDLAAHGVGRKERLRPPHPALAIAKSIATSLGLKDVEVYASSRHPYLMVAEPTNPVSLVLGEAIVAGNPQAIRFAAGAALKLAQLSLAVPARLPAAELAALTLAISRLTNPDVALAAADTDGMQAHLQKLRRILPSSVLADIKPLAAGLSATSAQGLARDLKIAGLRAGLAASGSLVTSLSVVAGAVGSSLQGVLSDPIGRGLISFALSEHRSAL